MTALSELLNQLAMPVHAGDRVRAFELARQIQQQLVRETHAQAAIERRVTLGRVEVYVPEPDGGEFQTHISINPRQSK